MFLMLSTKATAVIHAHKVKKKLKITFVLKVLTEDLMLSSNFNVLTEC